MKLVKDLHFDRHGIGRSLPVRHAGQERFFGGPKCLSRRESLSLWRREHVLPKSIVQGPAKVAKGRNSGGIVRARATDKRLQACPEKGERQGRGGRVNGNRLTGGVVAGNDLRRERSPATSRE